MKKKDDLNYEEAWNQLIKKVKKEEDRSLLAIVFEIAEYGRTVREIPGKFQIKKTEGE